MKRAAMLLAAIIAATVACAPQWTVFVAPDSSFSVEMPGNVRECTELMSLPSGHTTVQRVSSFAGPRGGPFSGPSLWQIRFFSMPAAPAGSATWDGAVAALRDEMAREWSGQVVEERPVEWSGHRGVEIRLEATRKGHKETSLARVILVGDRVICLHVHFRDDGQHEAMMARFFASLKLGANVTPP